MRRYSAMMMNGQFFPSTLCLCNIINHAGLAKIVLVVFRLLYYGFYPLLSKPLFLVPARLKLMD